MLIQDVKSHRCWTNVMLQFWQLMLTWILNAKSLKKMKYRPLRHLFGHPDPYPEQVHVNAILNVKVMTAMTMTMMMRLEI